METLNNKLKTYFKNSKNTIFPLILFAIFIFIFFLPIIAQKGFIGGDFLFGYPIFSNEFNDIKEFGVTLWSPYSFSGIFKSISGFFYAYLPNWISILFVNKEINYSYLIIELTIIFHFLLGAIFNFLLARYLKINYWGAIISGLIFSLSGVLVYKAMYPALIYSAIWLPLVFLFFHRGLERNKIRDIAMSGFFLAISALGSHIQITYYISLFLFFYAIFHIFIKNKENTENTEKNSLKKLIQISVSPFLKLSLTALIMIGSSFIILLPLINYVHSTWHSNIANPTGFQLSPTHFLLTLFLPHYFGGINQSEIYYGNWPVVDVAYYTGMISLVLSAVAVFVLLLENKTVKFLLISSVFFLLLSFGVYSPLYWFFYYTLPFFSSLTTPPKFMLFFAFSISLLAGFGIDAISQTMKKELENKIKILIGIILKASFTFTTLIVLVSLYKNGALVKNLFPEREQAFFSTGNITRDYLIFIFITFFIYFLFKKWFSWQKHRSVFAFLTVLILFFDLYAANSEFNYKNSINPEQYYNKRSVITFLETQNKTSYRLLMNNLLNDGTEILYKIPSLEGLGFSGLRYDKYTKGYFADIRGGTGGIEGNRLNLLNTRYALFETKPEKGNFQKVPEVEYLYENMDALPRLFLVHETETITGADSILTRIDEANFNPRQKIILEKPSPLANTGKNQENDKDKAVFTYYSPDQIEIYSYSKNPSMLFLSEMYYPGWKTFIDGNPAEIYQTNYLFRSVYLSEGPHAIKMVFDPNNFKLGRIIAIATLLILLMYFLLGIIRNKKFEGSY